MNKWLKYSMVIWLSLAAITWVQAQTDTLPSDQVEVLKRFNANLEKTDKVKFTPSAPSVDTMPREYEYRFDVYREEIMPEKATFEYEELRTDDLYNPYHGLIKVGYGLPAQPYLLASYGENKPAKHHWNAQINHHSFGQDNAFQDYALTSGEVNGGYRINNDWAVSAGVQGQSRRHQYYPLRNDTSFKESDVNRSLVSWHPEFNATGYWGAWRHSTHLDFMFDNDSEGPDQSRMILGSAIERNWDDHDHFFLEVEGQLGQVKIDTNENNIDYLKAHTAWRHNWGRFTTQLGLKVVTGEGLYILPDVNLGFILKDQIAHVDLSVSGDAAPLTMSEVLRSNPYWNPDQSFELFQSKLNFAATLRGKANNISYSVGSMHVIRDNQHFFLNDSIAPHLFNIIIDDMSYWGFNLDLKMRLGDHHTLGIKGERFIYSLKNQEKPWHLPSYRFHIFTEANILNKRLKVVPAFMLWGGAAFDVDNPSIVLNPIVEFNLDVGYKINDSWSLFIEGRNLLNRTNVRFNSYDAIGTRILAGIIYKL